MKNIGSVDRIIRLVLGLGLIIAGVFLQMYAGRLWWLAIPGAVFLLTSIIAFCPLYLPLGISTKGKN
jgi:hypothetical protein